MDTKIKIQVGEKVWTAHIVNNSSGVGFINLLKKGPLKIHMNDYGNFERLEIYQKVFQLMTPIIQQNPEI